MSLKLLFDTNIFIASTDIAVEKLHINATIVTELMELARQIDCDVYLHPGTRDDIMNQPNKECRDALLLKFKQWNQLAEPALRNDLYKDAWYSHQPAGNDGIDLRMLAAIDRDAVDILVTEDRRLRSHAIKAGYEDRVLPIQATIEYLKCLEGKDSLLPQIEKKTAYELDRNDPIFDSFRYDYPDFDQWFKKISKDHRSCYVMYDYEGMIEAIVILKVENDRPWGFPANTLKICSFKVASQAEGSLRGECMLKVIFRYAAQKNIESIYVEVHRKHDGIIHLFNQFGFHMIDKETVRGELILVKRRKPTSDKIEIDPLEYHREYGPPALSIEAAYVVPILPIWHGILFPEIELQKSVLGPEPSGNGIKKAYLSRANIKTIRPGSTLLFYRSKKEQGITAVGVVEKTLRTRDPDEIRKFVGLRTVYTNNQIQQQCMGDREVLAILFRYDRPITPSWKLKDLMEENILKAAPQTIQQVKDERGIDWLKSTLKG